MDRPSKGFIAVFIGDDPGARFGNLDTAPDDDGNNNDYFPTHQVTLPCLVSSRKASISSARSAERSVAMRSRTRTRSSKVDFDT